MKKIFAIIGIVFAIACFSSCKDEMEPFQEATGVSLDKTTLSIFPGDFVALKATVNPDNATSKYLEWSSSDTKIASVDNWGRVAGIAPGTAKITVKTASGGYTASCNVTVDPILETAISVDPTELTVYYDEFGTITATVEPSNASYKTVTWSSADETIATVDENGKVKGVGLGSTNITATSKNGLTAKCKVTVAVRMPTEAETVDLWKTDKAGFRGLYGAAADDGKAAGTGNWLKFENGAATWTANETGKIRTATLELSTGSKITITQLEGKDFADSWNMKSRLFNPNSGRTDKPKGTTGADISAVTLSAVTGTIETLDGNENSMELKGLYHDATMKVAFDINYEDKTVKMGLFYDRRTTQLAKEGVYCAFIPELESGKWSGYNFAPAKFGADDCNYAWLWLTGEDFNTFRYLPHSQHIAYGTADMMICGISIVIGTTSDPAALGTSYNTIYQANYNGSNTEGLSIYR